MDEAFPFDEEKAGPALTGAANLPGLPVPEEEHSPYRGVDRLSLLVASLGTLRIIFQHTAGMNASLDAHDCEALAAFIVLLEEDFERVLDGLYRESP